MDLDFSAEQSLLRDTVREICSGNSPLTLVRQLERDERGYAAPFWRALAEAGCLGLSIPEQYGGVGLGALEAVVAYEEFGRALAPSPHFESALLAAGLLLAAGSETQRQAWLPRIVDGSVVVIPCWQETAASPEPAAMRCRIEGEGETLRLSGEKMLVPFAGSADRLLVLARHPLQQRCLLALVPATAAGVTLTPQSNHADAPLFAVKFSAVAVRREDCLGWEEGIDAVWRAVFLRNLVPLAAQAVGGAERMLAMTNDYAKVRKQFDRPLGGFQAIAHYLADRATELEGAKTLVYQAAWAIDAGEPFERLALMAKLKACATFRKMTAVGTQIHGGIGFTSEADPQLFFRRAKHQQLMYGDPAWLEEGIAARVFAGDYPCVD